MMMVPAATHTEGAAGGGLVGGEAAGNPRAAGGGLGGEAAGHPRAEYPAMG